MKPRNPVSKRVMQYLIDHPKLQSAMMINQALKLVPGSQDKKTVSRFLVLQLNKGLLKRIEVSGQFYYSRVNEVITKADMDAITPMYFQRRGIEINYAKPEPVKEKSGTQAQTVEEFLAAGGVTTILPGTDFSKPDLRRRPT